MAYKNFHGIPGRGLPLRGWPDRGIPGAEPVTVITKASGSGKGGSFWKTQHKIRMHDDILHREDKELMEIVTAIAKSGILN